LISSVISEEGIIFDTRNNNNLELNWPVFPFNNGWEESTVYANGRDYQQLTICNIANTKIQNNWIRSNYIPNQDQARLIYIDISFSVRTCQDLANVKSCRESFHLYFHETEETDLPVNERTLRHFKKVDTIAAENRFKPGQESTPNQKTLRIENLKGEKGFFLAIRDEGACLSIQHIKIYYKYCPEMTSNFVSYPKTITGPELYSQSEAMGRCVQNAENSRMIGHPVKICTGNGQWSSFDSGTCLCKPGYEEHNTNGVMECKACPENTYKSTSGSDYCKRCPLHSSTEASTGQQSCKCKPSYYKASSDPEHMACTQPPSKVSFAKSEVDGQTIKLSWAVPRNSGGRLPSDLKYQVQCAICDDTCTPVRSCSTANVFLQSKVHIANDLQPGKLYRFRIYAYNSVSELASSSFDFYELFEETKLNPTEPILVQNEKLIKTVPSLLDPTDFPEESESYLSLKNVIILVSSILLILCILVLYFLSLKLRSSSCRTGTNSSYNGSTSTAESKIENQSFLKQSLSNRTSSVLDIARFPSLSNPVTGTMKTGGWKFCDGTGKMEPCLIDIQTVENQDFSILSTLATDKTSTISKANILLSSSQTSSECLNMPITHINFSSKHHMKQTLYLLHSSKSYRYILTPEFLISSCPNAFLTENIEFTSLYDYLPGLSFNQKLNLCYQCLQAIEHAEVNLQVRFEKLTCDNFAVTKSGEIRLYKFHEQYSEKNCTKYLPLEVLTEKSSKICLIWQIGTLIWEILSGRKIYSENNSEDMKSLISSGFRTGNPEKTTPNSIYSMILKCWSEKPSGRPKLSHIIDEIRRSVSGNTIKTPSKSPIGVSLGARSYSSIGTLETSSNDERHKHALTVVPIEEGRVDIRFTRGTTIEV